VKRAHTICQPCETLLLLLLQAGVIGLACARAAAQAGLEVVLLEQEASYGTATSSRHSEVIHAGIYYPAGKLVIGRNARNLLHYFSAMTQRIRVHSCTAAVG
jgi:L-2-hydroxyglutarate oxidase LhgO